jgi:hypothetical protein
MGRVYFGCQGFLSFLGRRQIIVRDAADNGKTRPFLCQRPMFMIARVSVVISIRISKCSAWLSTMPVHMTPTCLIELVHRHNVRSGFTLVVLRQG